MRASAFVTALAVIAPMGASGAEAQSRVDDAEPSVAPATLVAERARALLHDESREAWLALAGALPELAISGQANLESTFEAARLAEEMGQPLIALPMAGPATPSASLDAEREEAGLDALGVVWRAVRSTDLDALARLLALAIGIGTLAMVGRGPRTKAAKVRPTRSAARYRDVRSLAANGVSITEISRRTGLAREAVTVLLRSGVS